MIFCDLNTAVTESNCHQNHSVDRFRISSIHSVCHSLHHLKVQCTVAPYEADAQLAYLCREGYVDAVIAEDSDTIPYGCKEVRQQNSISY